MVQDPADPSLRQHRVSITRILDARVEHAFASWTEPPLMRGWVGSKVDADVRVGGRYRWESSDSAGGVYVHVGDYLVIDPPRRLVMTFRALGRGPNPYRNEIIEVRFRALDDGRTELVLTNAWDGPGPTGDDAETLKAGWSSWIDLLDAALARTG